MPRIVALLCAAVAVLPWAAGAAADLLPPVDPCASAAAGVVCRLGTGETTPGGAANQKASHAGWPAITGVYLVLDHGGRTATGTERNDELLGGHGSDRMVGGPGRDVLWGDMLPTQNNTWQHDTLIGGSGRDFLYASHGRNLMLAGAGADVVHGHYGRGRIDCGPGTDLLYLSHRSRPHYRIRRCERITYHSGLTPLTPRG